MRRQHRKDGYQFLSGLNLGNTGLIVAVAGILLTLFLMSNILPLVDEPENREFCKMVRILYDLDDRGKFTRPALGTAPVAIDKQSISWVSYHSLSDYAHDNVKVPDPGSATPTSFAAPFDGTTYETDGLSVSISHYQDRIKDNISELLDPAARKMVEQKSLFAWLRESLGRDLGEFNCKTINSQDSLAMLITSAIHTDGADSVEVYDLPGADALLLKKVFKEHTRLELLYQDLDRPGDGLIIVRLDTGDQRSDTLTRELVGAWHSSANQ